MSEFALLLHSIETCKCISCVLCGSVRAGDVISTGSYLHTYIRCEYRIIELNRDIRRISIAFSYYESEYCHVASCQVFSSSDQRSDLLDSVFDDDVFFRHLLDMIGQISVIVHCEQLFERLEMK